jgi:hypothetical protein
VAVAVTLSGGEWGGRECGEWRRDWLLDVDCLVCFVFVLMVFERQPSNQK